LTTCGGITLTENPSSVSQRAQWCTPPLASIPTATRGACSAMNRLKAARFSRLRATRAPSRSNKPTSKTDFAESMAIVLISFMDLSPFPVARQVVHGPFKADSPKRRTGKVHPIIPDAPQHHSSGEERVSATGA